MKFMDLPDEYCGENSKVVIVPAPYEKDLTFGKGASKGPEEIIKASKHLEYYDDELDSEPFEVGIRVVPSIKLDNLSPEDAHNKIIEESDKYSDKFFIGLGGDHSVSSGFIESLAKKHKNLSILIFDAHTDLRHSWNNSIWNHACVTRRLAHHPIATIGVRSMDISERDFLKTEEGKNIKVVKAYELTEEKINEVMKHLTDTVFISIDVDVFDPSFIRNTGTPEPGGLDWYTVLRILRKVFKEKNVIGADVVEFAPNNNFDAEAFSLAKLVYKLVSYKYS